MAATRRSTHQPEPDGPTGTADPAAPPAPAVPAPAAPSAAPRARRPRRPRGSLNQQVITEAALRICDRAGIDALTFDALGRELDAHPTAIYRHFRDKDELLLALTDALHAQATAGGLPVTDDWARDLRAVAHRIRGAFMAHPQVGQLVAARTARRQHEFEVVEYILGCMRRAGLSDRDAARCYRVFADAVLAYASMEATLHALDAPTREADLRSWEVEYRALPADRFPNLAALLDEIPPLDSADNFELAVDLLIDSIRARSGN
ncbi:TetR/AcrR family transcriptional regulator [Streptacidiphilus sp. P02-A3a]|uniref:TetR/AcrR family transcriptional regulator n=1 Tax=Streptacidiphilus sp. P02-A3a TaxID=2704468 RepID=UPI0015FD6F0D|nr:TetR/AcrR family transcriptional regulator [Streptacidiphilus sp. P02-A3a]QMU70790.1 TetR/AcrR family transcriptional regulator [Streptacidiphilus sp. P02-A3a]